MTSDDMALVREYAQSNSEQAFAALVSQHINLVYSVALRQVHDPHMAEEITQAVFIILARKAKSLSPKTILAGWLCRTARYVSADALKIQRRRQFHEQESQMQSTLDESVPDVWAQFAPHLDEALKCLAEKEHNAIVLRFFEGKDFRQVGAVMGTGEDAARKRVNHGVEKLRKFFSKRGIMLSAAMIAGAVSAHSVQAAPVGLAKSVTAIAIAKGVAVSGSVLTLVKGVLKTMAWAKAKTAFGICVGILLVGGTVATGSKWLHLTSLSDEIHFAEMSETGVPPQDGLRVGSSVLGWSLHANGPVQRDGYIYMRDERPEGGNKPLWEFALTAKRRLADVTKNDLECQFYGMNDPRGPDVFGGVWVKGVALLVPEGQIFFARLVTDPSVIYIIRLAKQGGSQSRGTMQIEYRIFAKQPSN